MRPQADGGGPLVTKTPHAGGGHAVPAPCMRDVCAGCVRKSCGSQRVGRERPHISRDAAHERWRVHPLRGQERRCHHAQGGQRRRGLRGATRSKRLPHVGQRGGSRAGVGSVTVGYGAGRGGSTVRTPRHARTRVSTCRCPGRRKPSARTVMPRSGSTCGRNRRMHSGAGSVADGVCGVAESWSWNGRGPSSSVRMRGVLMATRTLHGAR